MEENTPLSPPPAPAPRGPKQGNNRTLLYILVAAVLLLGVSLVVVFMQKENETERAEVLEEKKDDLQAELKQLDQKTEELERALVDSKLDNKQKKEMIKKLNDEIVYLKVRLDKALKEGALNKQQKEEFEGKYRQLEYYNERYRSKIKELEEVIKEQETRITRLSANVDSLEERTFKLEGETIIHKEKLKVASMLKATGLTHRSVNSRGKEDTELKQRRMRGYKGCLTLPKVEVADVGSKTLYLLLYKPDGSLYHTPETGSGFFSTSEGEKAYTAKTTIHYNREQTTACVNYTLPADEEFVKGKFTVVWMTRRDGDDNYHYVLATEVLSIR